MKYIIMCGGNYDKWETPRQMIRIRDEPVVARTIRLLRDYGVDDIAISTEDSRFAQFGVPLLHCPNNFVSERGIVKRGSWVEAFCLMAEPACYIMGDVVFSPAAIQVIVNTETDGIQFFASCPPFPPEYIKKHAEPFAFKVADQERFRAAIDFVKINVDTGIFCRHPISWELWQVINGKNVRDIDYGSYVVINDYTCDIDCPADAGKIEEEMP